MRTLTGTAADGHQDSSYRLVWLVEIDADEPGAGQTTLRYASRAYTLDGNAYSDALLPDGIRCGWMRVRPRGGLAQVADFSVRFANHEQVIDLQDVYTLDNDAVRLYAIFATGAETDEDKVRLQTGVAEGSDWEAETWHLRCIDASDKDFRAIPTQKVNLDQHPNAPLSEYGKVIPWTFGYVNQVPGDAQYPYVPATRCLDRYQLMYTKGYFAAYQILMFVWEPEANTTGYTLGTRVDQAGNETVDSDAWAGIVPINTNRVLYHYLTVASADNTAASYWYVADLDADTYATVESGQTLSVMPAGIGALGLMNTAKVKCEGYTGSGAYSITITYDDAEVYTASGVTTDTSDDLSASLNANWDVTLLQVDITPDGATAALIKNVHLELDYEAQNREGQLQVPRCFLRWWGYKSSTATQHHVIPGTADTYAVSPAEILAAVLTAYDLYDLPASAIDVDALAAAHAARDDTHVFAFQMMETVTWEYWNRFCFEAALHVFKSFEGKWKVVARDKDAAAQHYLGPDHIARRNPRDLQSAPDVALKRTPTRAVINEIVLRYAWDPMTEQPLKMKVRSPQYRYTGTCTVDAAAGTLTDASATFQSGKYPAFAGERVYVDGWFTLSITNVNSDTELGVALWEHDDGDLDDVTDATTYYGGSGVSGKAIRSWQRYKTINPLGGEFDPITRQGGWPSRFIYDDDTAEVFLDYVEDWFSQRRIVLELATFMNALSVELGDVCYLRCPILPDRRDAVPLGALNGAIDADDTTLTCSTDGYLGNEAFRDGDYLAIGAEVVHVDGDPAAGDETLTIVRGQTNTTAAAHADGAAVYLLDQTWEVTGVRYDIAKAQIRLELTEMPRASYRVGCALSADATYDSLSWEARMARSWALRGTGLIEQTDPHSDYSYAG